MKEGFKCADPWLLLSIIYANQQGNSSLLSIIGFGDAINHAIFSLEELQGGVGRLIKFGYIIKKRNKFVPTDKILISYKKSCNKRRHVFKELEFIRKELKAPAWSDEYHPSKANVGCSYKGITKEILEKAYNEYIQKVKQ